MFGLCEEPDSKLLKRDASSLAINKTDPCAFALLY